MRARLGLAQALWAMGDQQAAIEHLHDMLRLNPGDNQGVGPQKLGDRPGTGAAGSADRQRRRNSPIPISDSTTIPPK